MNTRAWGLLPVAIAAFAALPLDAAEADRRLRSILENVAGLEKPVTYTEAKIPLGELVEKVAKDTGTPLRASREVADEPIMLCLRDFPARELLEQLAELLDYRWRPSAPAARSRLKVEGSRSQAGPSLQRSNLPPSTVFEIYQDVASRQREEALREQLFAEVEKSLRDQVRALAEVAALPPTEVARLAEEGKRFREETRELPPARSEGFYRDPRNRQRSVRYAAAEAIQSPVQGALAWLLVTLPEAHWATLRAGDELTFSTDPKRGELRLPAETERRLRSARPTALPPGARLAYPTPEAEEKLRRQDQALQEAWAAASGFRVHVRLDLQRVRTQASAWLEARATPFREEGDLSLGFLTVGTDLRLWGFARGPLPGQEDAPLPRDVLEKDTVLGATHRFQPRERPFPNDNGPTAPPWWRFTDLLSQIVETYDVHLLSDAYGTSQPALYTDQLVAGPMALFELLERATGGTHRWDRRGRLIRLRHKRWFLERHREIPLRYVRRWKEAVDRHGALPIEMYTEMVAALRDAQLEALSQVADLAGLPRELGVVGFFRDGVRLYASLTPAQQQALWRGGRIQVLEMNAASRALFLKTLHTMTRRRPADPEPLATATLSLRAEPMVRTRHVHGDRVTFEDVRVKPDTPPPPAGADDRADAPRRYPVLNARLLLECGLELRANLDLVVPAPP